MLVQRLLSAKNTTHAKAGSIMAGYMKILPLFLMAWPGIIARVLFPGMHKLLLLCYDASWVKEINFAIY